MNKLYMLFFAGLLTLSCAAQNSPDICGDWELSLLGTWANSRLLGKSTANVVSAPSLLRKGPFYRASVLMPGRLPFDQARYCQLEQSPTDPLLFLAYNQPRYKHRERPVVKHR
jgi:hypothetical protein